jgi:hypothetical protein
MWVCRLKQVNVRQKTSTVEVLKMQSEHVFADIRLRRGYRGLRKQGQSEQRALKDVAAPRAD